MSGAVGTGSVCLRMLCVTIRRTVKMEVTRPLVKPVSGNLMIYKHVTQTIKQLTFIHSRVEV